METIGALAAGVAHDFNNLVQAIRGNVSLLLLDEKNPEPLKYRLQQIDEAASQASDITQQLLSFSRASDETEAVLDFNLVIRDAGHLLTRSSLNKVQLKLEPADRPAKVRIHPTRAQQCLLNLCVNAQDAMPNGGDIILRNEIVTLTTTQAALTNHSGGSAFVKCSIIDGGTGIPQDLLPRIFDPFFTTKAAGKGTGLGLPIVHSIVTQAGGFIEVDSVAGKGTSFHLYFPTVNAELTERARNTPAELVKGSGRLMVVDDLDLVLDFTGTFLRAAGYEVLTATSTEEALEILNSLPEPIDLLFTDYNMSGRNGIQLIKEVASRWPKIKFILASGYLEANERTLIEKEFSARILNKPFNIRETAEMIAVMLDPENKA
jgi:two-component system cell cycle sensor histidine kinase/response regulator CckA